MTNLSRVRNVLETLGKWGVREVVLCAGARNAPLIVALHELAERKRLRAWHFFEERSAAFFALGRMKSAAGPVAVVTTSGTAAAELLPATIEAHYSGLPLVLVTADRPPHYRGSAAPQAIEQVGLFSHYVAATYDWFDGGGGAVAPLGNRPVHLNVGFTEPAAAELAAIEDEVRSGSWDYQPLQPTAPRPVAMAGDEIAEFAARCRRPLILAGPIDLSEVAWLPHVLAQTKLPIYAEALSNLAGRSELAGQLVRGGERGAMAALERGWVDGVIRVGGVPTTRLWRDLEAKWRNVPVLSLSRTRFTGLGRTAAVASLEKESLLELSRRLPTPELPMEWLNLMDRARDRLRDLGERWPKAEPALVMRLARELAPAARVYLGNSLAVREWDLAVAAGLGATQAFSGNRGANGIDGQLSTFLGFSAPANENWCLVGDLTALYDLSAPWVVKQLSTRTLNLVVLNNGGGRIFSRLYGRETLENSHHLEFSPVAALWGLEYEIWNQIPARLPSAGARLIEVRPEPEATSAFWRGWEEFWQNPYASG